MWKDRAPQLKGKKEIENVTASRHVKDSAFEEKKNLCQY
jgi:hypothetical protein